ncbi:hypothetical protein H0H92_004928 [Tricholoma furcatifolium]|nr:hypothetical protein H0H92_004928 [Tricholoma furcatifolium]
MLVAARCVRAASTSARRFSSKPDPAVASQLETLIAGLHDAKPPLPTPNEPPTGTAYPPPSPTQPNPKNQKLDSFIDRTLAPEIRYSLYCKSTRNNTITTLMDDKWNPVAWWSGGRVGFKHVNRSTYEAGYQCAVKMFHAIEEAAKQTPFKIDLYFKGFGQGRDAMHRALLTSEGERVRQLVVSITDRTPIKIGGTRAKKARRL